jgi:hypothetical protein
MTRMVLTLMLAFIAGLAPFGLLTADVLLIEEVRQAERMDLPENGQSMDDVRARFGDPASKNAAVGDPPITRWDFERFSVYYEYGLVLFTVLHKGAVIDKRSEVIEKSDF